MAGSKQPTSFGTLQDYLQFAYTEHEEHDEYLCVVNKTFRNEEEGYESYNEYAKIKGFSIRKEKVKYLPCSKTRFRRLTHALKKDTVRWRTSKDLTRKEPQKILLVADAKLV